MILAGTVEDVRDRMDPGEFDIVRALFGDPRFHKWIQLQQEASRNALVSIDPRQFLGKPEEYQQAAMDAQLLWQFYQNLLNYARDVGISYEQREQTTSENRSTQ